MAIDGFKEIVERRGYKVNSEDRKIFEREIGKSYFGLGNADMIEFILFDANDNKLPQGESGKFVRYIHLNDSNIKDYFLISDNNFTKKLNGASEFIVDIERLVREAGYSNGIFKTQVTLLNRRAGSEPNDNDKLWIHEISPSRTEIRLLPLKNKKQPNLDLEKRYETFVENRQFRDDTIYYAKKYIENITTDNVLNSFSTIKGTQSDGETYRNLIKKEFKIDSIENFVRRVRDKFIQSMDYFISGREWNINSINYGKPKEALDSIELTIQTINRTCEQSLINILQAYLPKRTIQEENELTPEQQVTFDEVKQILKSSVSDSLYDSTIPDKIDAVVRGCTDPDALNYNPLAKENDGSCKYREIIIDPIEIGGCLNPKALNYNPNATFDDGSCKYKEIKITPLQKTQTYYIWSDTANIKYKDKGVIRTIDGVEYDSFKITFDEETIKWTGDVRLVPKIKKPEPIMVQYRVKNSEQGKLALTFAFRDALGNIKTSGVLKPGSTTLVCAEKGSLVLPNTMKAQEFGKCGDEIPPDPILGCTDKNAINYKKSATQDDGSCRYEVRGCTDPKALNYNPAANFNDGSCRYTVRGCTDPTALNFNRQATQDDGSCIYREKTPVVRGCTNRNAINYNADATVDDGSCRYVQQGGGGTGGGGGGGRNPQDVFDGEQSDPTNPFTNRGDFTNRRNPEQNIR